jgi:hypothetical protein
MTVMVHADDFVAVPRRADPYLDTVYPLCGIVLLVGGFAAAALLLLLRMPLVMASMGPLLLLLAVLGAIHVGYRIGRPHSRFALGAGALIVLIASVVIGGIISHAGLRFRSPLIDDALLSFDHKLGIRTEDVVRAMALHPAFLHVLAIFYSTTMPGILLVTLGLAAARRHEEVWDLCYGFSASIVVAALISIFIPAVGVVAFRHLDSLPGMPHGAGTYYLKAFYAYRDGKVTAMDISRLSGVVEFPSFHTVMALVVPYALRRWRPLFRCACAWSAIILISTMPIGGHYVADVMAGALLWAVLMVAAKAVRRRAASKPYRPTTIALPTDGPPEEAAAEMTLA